MAIAERGLNFGPVAYFSPSPFADMVRASQWAGDLATSTSFSNPQNTPVPAQDAAGWPVGLNAGQSLRIILQRADNCPNGDYTIVADGVGTLNFSWPNSVTNGQKNVTLKFDGTSSGRTQVVNCPTVSPFGTFNIILKASEPNNYLRNIKVMRPGYAEGAMFRTDFVESVRWAYALRFMQWLKTIGSDVVHWSDRASTSQYSAGTPAGVPYEYAFQLANTIDKAAWINIPGGADDDFVSQLATLANNAMNYDNDLYVEFSNEYWNAAYPEYHTFARLGLDAGLSTNETQAALKWGGRRAAQCFQIFKQIYKGKLCCVLAAQSANIGSFTTQINYLNSLGLLWTVDAFAGAPYFFATKTVSEDYVINTWPTDQATVLDNIFAGCYAYIDGQIAANAQALKGLCDQYGRCMVAYECGQSLVATTRNADTVATDAYIAANHDPRMYDLYNHYIQVIQGAGYRLLNFYNHCGPDNKFGMWGLLNYMGQPLVETPKWHAVASVLYP